MSINKVLIEGELCAMPIPVPNHEKSLALLKVISTDSISTPSGAQLLSNKHDIVLPVSQLKKLSKLGSQIYIEGSLLHADLLSSYGLNQNVIWGKTLHVQNAIIQKQSNG